MRPRNHRVEKSKKVCDVYISPYCRQAPVPPNFMKFGIRGQLIDVITCVKFLVNQLRGYRVLTLQNCHFPSTCCIALKTVYAHCHATLWNVFLWYTFTCKHLQRLPKALSIQTCPTFVFTFMFELLISEQIISHMGEASRVTWKTVTALEHSTPSFYG